MNINSKINTSTSELIAQLNIYTKLIENKNELLKSKIFYETEIKSTNTKLNNIEKEIQKVKPNIWKQERILLENFLISAKANLKTNKERLFKEDINCFCNIKNSDSILSDLKEYDFWLEGKNQLTKIIAILTSTINLSEISYYDYIDVANNVCKLIINADEIQNINLEEFKEVINFKNLNNIEWFEKDVNSEIRELLKMSKNSIKTLKTFSTLVLNSNWLLGDMIISQEKRRKFEI